MSVTAERAVRSLTPAQDARLSAIALTHPKTRVVGWDDRHGGPVLLYASGVRRALSSAARLVQVKRGE